MLVSSVTRGNSLRQAAFGLSNQIVGKVELGKQRN